MSKESYKNIYQGTTDDLIRIMRDVEEEAARGEDHRVLPNYKKIYDFLAEWGDKAEFVINQKGSEDKFPLEIAGDIASASDLLKSLYRCGQYLNLKEGPSFLFTFFKKFSFTNLIGDYISDLIAKGALLKDEEFNEICNNDLLDFYLNEVNRFHSSERSGVVSSNKNQTLNNQVKTKVETEPSITEEESTAIEFAINDLIHDKGSDLDIGGISMWWESNKILYTVDNFSNKNETVLGILKTLASDNHITRSKYGAYHNSQLEGGTIEYTGLTEDAVKVLMTTNAVLGTNYPTGQYINKVKTSYKILIPHIEFHDSAEIQSIGREYAKDGKEIDVNTKVHDFDLPIFIALKDPNCPSVMIEYLIRDFNADVNVVDELNHSPLYYALKIYDDELLNPFNKSEIIKLLLEAEASLNNDEKVTEAEQDYLTYVREVILDTSTANDNLEETRGSDVLELPVLEIKLEDKLIHVLEDALNAEVGKRTEIPGTELYLIKSGKNSQTLEIKNPEKNISSGSEQFIIERLEMLASSKSIKIINENFLDIRQIFSVLHNYLKTAGIYQETVFIDNTDLVLVPGEMMTQHGMQNVLSIFVTNNSIDEKGLEFRQEIIKTLYQRASTMSIPLKKGEDLKQALIDSIKPLLDNGDPIPIQNKKMMLYKQGNTIICENAPQNNSDMKLLELLHLTLSEQGFRFEAYNATGKIISFSNPAPKEAKVTDPMKILLDKVVGGEKKVQIEGTNFLAEQDANKHIRVYNNSESKTLNSIKNAASELGAELKFISTKCKEVKTEKFEENDFNSLLFQVVCEEKCLLIPEVNLIVKKDGDLKIECHAGGKILDIMKSLRKEALDINKICYLEGFENPPANLPYNVEKLGDIASTD